MVNACVSIIRLGKKHSLRCRQRSTNLRSITFLFFSLLEVRRLFSPVQSSDYVNLYPDASGSRPVPPDVETVDALVTGFCIRDASVTHKTRPAVMDVNVCEMKNSNNRYITLIWSHGDCIWLLLFSWCFFQLPCDSFFKLFLHNSYPRDR